MVQNRVLLSVKRCKQHPSECAIAATACIAHYYDPSVEYEGVREMIPPRSRKGGMTTWQQCSLFNKLGFNKVTVVTFDLELVDFTWSKLTKKGLIRKLKKMRAHYGRSREPNYKDYTDKAIKWLEDENNDNNLIIDHDLPRYIKREINAGRPLGASFNWTSAFRFVKTRYAKAPKNSKRINGEFDGQAVSHSVIIRGYDDKGIFVVDSHHQYYKGKLKKYKNGYYKLSWEKFLVNVPMGDLILADYK